MSDLFGIGTNALRAFQTAIDITGENIANVYTPTYKRKTVHLTSQEALGSLQGVKITDIAQNFDRLAQTSLQNMTSIYHKQSIYLNKTQQLEGVMSNEFTDIRHRLNGLFNAFETANLSPSSTTARETVISEAKTVVDAFHFLQTELANQYKDTNTQLKSTVNEVNNILNELGAIDKNLSTDTTQNHALFDQREQLLYDLAKYINFTVNEMDSGRINLVMDTGDVLLTGSIANQLTIVPNAQDSRLQDVAVVNEMGPVVISDYINSGEIAGLLAYRKQVLNTTEDRLGRLALSISDQFNTQNHKGLNLNGQLGGDIFFDINSTNMQLGRVQANSDNTGSGSLQVEITDTNALKVSDYFLSFSSPTNYILTRQSDNTAVASGAIGGYPHTITVDGFEIDISAGSFQNGDHFAIAPTQNASEQFAMRATSGADLALALPVRTRLNSNNTGKINISALSIVDETNANLATPGQLTPPVQVEFLSTTTYQLVNSNTSAVIEGPIAYNPANENALFPTPGNFDPGYQLSLSGPAKTGDIVHLEYNQQAANDNRNGLNLSALFNQTNMGNSSLNFHDDYVGLTNTVSSEARNSDVAKSASNVLMTQAQNRRDSAAGVNLDEEATNLLKYQQAYQANAQIISVANQLFDTLIGTLGR